MARGNDPAEERATARKSITVGELCRRYLDAAEAGLILGKRRRPKKASTLATDRGRIERHIKPLLRRRRVIDLTLADVARFARDVARGATATTLTPDQDGTIKKRGRAIVKGGRGTATRTVGLLGGILSYAVSEGIRADNPARGVQRFAHNRRKVVLSREQYHALGRALNAAEIEGENRKATAAIELIALTGCRRGEIVRLRHEEVNERAGCFGLIDSKEAENIRPIGKPAFDVIRQLSKNGAGEFVFDGENGKGAYGGLPKAWLRIRAREKCLSGTNAARHAPRFRQRRQPARLYRSDARGVARPYGVTKPNRRLHTPSQCRAYRRRRSRRALHPRDDDGRGRGSG